MKILRVTFLGVGGLADTSLDLGDPRTGEPHDLVVLTGPPSCGTTRALEAIVAAKEAIAPYGPMAQGAPWVASGAPVAKVALSFWLDEEEQVFAAASSPIVEAEARFSAGRVRREADEGLVALLGRYAHGAKAGKVEYFPTTRRLPTHAPFGGLGVLEQRAARASKDARKYSFVVRFLHGIAADPPAERAFADKLAALSGTCRYEREPSPGGVPRCLRSRGGAPAAVTEISDAEADAVLFAATAVVLGLHRSLVLIDRPDLHAHPSEIPRLLTGLRALGEGNQLLLASPSPAVAAAAPEGVVTLEVP